MENYEKKYKEALERAKNIYGASESRDILSTLTTIFPELAESKDEKIRKELLESFKYQQRESRTDKEWLNGIKLSEVVAWLEKQKVTDEEIIFRPLVGTDIRIAAKQALEKIDTGKKVVLAFNGAYIPVNGKTVGEIDSEYDTWLEKQGEQEEPQVYETEDGEVITYSESEGYQVLEPKFKVGDWVVQGCNLLKIRCVGDKYYCYETVGGYVDDMLVSEIDSLYHLWTIRDAKDGDVLVASDGSIFIFKEVDDNNCKHYIALTADKVIKVNVGLKHFWESSRAVHPAVKKQRDLLFKKMHEAGYEWNAEKKELKKIQS